MNNAQRRFVFHIKKSTPLYFLYTILVFVLAHCVWPRIQASEFTMYQYVLDVDFFKFLVCFSVGILMFCIVNSRYSENDSFSAKVILFLTMFYFIPGMAMCSALNEAWNYIISYIAYFSVLIVSDILIKHPRKLPLLVKEKRFRIVINVLICVCIIYPFFVMVVFDKGFSIANFLAALNDTYGVRAQARENSMPWAFLLIENWGVYFGALMITYSLRRKKHALAIVFVVIELFYFSLQGNRIYLFITGIAVVLGIVKAKKQYIAWAFVGVLLAQFLEIAIFQEPESIGFVTSIYRRFSVVPNAISPKYFDYFQTNTPDFLRGNFENIANLLGVKSEYGFNVGTEIGKQYFKLNMNANTGMVGGAFFEFAYLGIILDPIMMILSLRVFDKILLRAEKEYTVLIAFMYASLAINSWALWSQLIRISYMLLFVISIYLVFNTMVVREE